MVVIYGIPNCDVTKKALKWLDANKVAYHFYDYKKEAITKEKLKDWSQQIGWEKFFNKRSTTWRELDEAVQSKINDKNSAIEFAIQNNSIIKRPMLEINKTIAAVGFDEKEWKQLFPSKK
jgi:arsenate reductase (glutaredoxin)